MHAFLETVSTQPEGLDALFQQSRQVPGPGPGGGPPDGVKLHGMLDEYAKAHEGGLPFRTLTLKARGSGPNLLLQILAQHDA